MPELATAYVNIVSSTRDLGRDIQQQLGAGAGKGGTAAGRVAGKSFTASVSGFATNAGKLLTAGITVPAAAASTAVSGLVGHLGFKRLVALDTAKAQFKGLGLNVSAVMDRVSKGVENTSLSMADGASLAVSAMATGNLPLKDLESQIKRVANVSAAYHVDTAQAGYLLNNILTKNKVTYGDLSQMEQNNIPIISALAKHYGVTGDEIQKMAQKGQISIEDFNKVLDGSSGKAAEAYKNSFQGIADNIKANLGKVGAKVLEPVFNQIKPMMKQFLSFLQSPMFGIAAGVIGQKLGVAFAKLTVAVKGAITWFKGLSPATQKTIATIAGLAVAAGPALLVFGKILPLIGKIGPAMTIVGTAFKTFGGILSASPIGRIIALISALAAGLTYFFTKTKTGQQLWGQLVAQFKNVLPILQPVIAAFAQAGQSIMSSLGPVLQQLGQTLLPVIVTMVQQLAPVFMNLVSTVLPPLAQLLATVGQAVGQLVTALAPLIAEIVSTLIPVIAQIIQAVAPLISQIVTTLLPVIKSILSVVQTVFNAIIPVIQGALQIVSGVIKTVTSLIKGDWSGVWEGIKQIFAGVWNTIKALVSAAIKIVWSVLKAGLTVIKTGWSVVWQGIKGVASAVWSTIKTVIGGAINGIKSAISTSLTAIKSAWSASWNAVKTLVSKVWDGIKTGVKNGIGAVVGFVSGLKGKVTGAIGDAGKWLLDAGAKIIGGLVNGIKSAIGKVKDVLGSVTNLIPSWKGPPSTDKKLLTPAGRMIMQGLVVGINGEVGSLRQTLIGVTDTAVSTVQSELDIHSPSRVFKTIGTFLGQGFVDGIAGTQKQVKAAASKLVQQTKDAYDKRADLVKASNAKVASIQKKLNALPSSNTAAQRRVSKAAARVADAELNLKKKQAAASSKLSASQQSAARRVSQAQAKLTAAQAKNNKKSTASSRAAVKSAKTALSNALYAQKKTKTSASAAAQASVDAAKKSLKAAKSSLADAKYALSAADKKTAAKRKELKASLAAAKADAKANKGLTTRSESAVVKALTAQQKKLDTLAKQRDSVASKLKTSQKSLDDLVKARTSYVGQVADNLMGSADVTNMGRSSAQIIKTLTKTRDGILTFQSQISQLQKAGLNKDALDQIVQAGVSDGGVTAKALLTGGASAIKQVNALQSQVSKAAQAVGTTAGDAMYKSGIQAAQGLVKGLQSQQSSITRTMTKIANQMASTVKKALKIHSPSRVFRDDVGAMIPAGILVGAQAGAPALNKGLAGMVDPAPASVGSGATGGSGRTGSAQINMYTHDPHEAALQVARELRMGAL